MLSLQNSAKIKYQIVSEIYLSSRARVQVTFVKAFDVKIVGPNLISKQNKHQII